MRRSLLKKRAQRKAIIILALSLGIASTATATLLINRPPERDSRTACRLDGAVSKHLVVMVDRSETWSVQQTILLKRALQRLATTLPPKGRLSVGAFAGRTDPSNLFVFDRCNPGDGSTVSWLTGRPDLARKEYIESFLKPINQHIDELTRPHASNETHIANLIANIAVRFSYRGSRTKPLLVLFSDMREHNQAFSFYSRQTPQAFLSYFAATYPGSQVPFDLAVYALKSKASSRATPVKEIKAAWQQALAERGINLTWHRL